MGFFKNKYGKNKRRAKALAREKKEIESESSTVPRTMVFCKPDSGKYVRQLVEDFKVIMEPYTTRELKCSRKNKISDFIREAGPLNVKYIIYFSYKTPQNETDKESQKYGVYCNVICVPHGPTLIYKVSEYVLKKDIQTISGFGMNKCWLQQPPMLILHGFGDKNCSDHVKAVAESFHYMFPEFNASKTRINSVRRAFFISRQKNVAENNCNDEVFVLRHYFIRWQSKEVNKNIINLGIGTGARNLKLPDLSQYYSIADYIKHGEQPSESENEEEETVFDLKEEILEIPGEAGKASIKLMEVGPRLTLTLVKIQVGVNAGDILFDRTKTAEELKISEKKRLAKDLVDKKLKYERRIEQEQNVLRKKQLKEEEKIKCGKKAVVKEEGKGNDDEVEADTGVEKTRREYSDNESNDEEEEDDSDFDENELEEIDDSLDELESDEENFESGNDSDADNDDESDSLNLTEVDEVAQNDNSDFEVDDELLQELNKSKNKITANIKRKQRSNSKSSVVKRQRKM